jgi:hypothetical protein
MTPAVKADVIAVPLRGPITDLASLRRTKFSTDMSQLMTALRTRNRNEGSNR